MSIIQILKVNEERSGVKDGRPWSMQDCECIVLHDDGSVDMVGVLRLGKELHGKVVPGTYIGSYSLRASMRERQISPQLVGLTPYQVGKNRPPVTTVGMSGAAPAASAPASTSASSQG